MVPGVSLLTQILYALVFFTRYLDLFSSASWTFGTYGAGVLWNTPFKIMYLTSSAYLIYIIMRVYPRTRERERAWKLGIWLVIGSVVTAPIAMAIAYRGFPSFWLSEVSQQCSHEFGVERFANRSRIISYSGPSQSFLNRSVFCLNYFFCVKLPFPP